jgi:predicted nuclease of predicted toxin-antitoxin system
VTFLLDHDVPENLTHSLRALAHKVIRVQDVLPRNAPDPKVLSYANETHAVLITCNRDDFLNLTQAQPHSGLIILIRRKTRVAERSALVRLLDRAGASGLSHNINFA